MWRVCKKPTEMEGLEKPKEVESLEKPTEMEGLEKPKGEVVDGLEKPEAKAKLVPRKCVVMVDWHLTLELDQVGIPKSHKQALEKLMEKCEVHICSYVGSWKRWREVKDKIDDLEWELGKEMGRHLVWESTGQEGKAKVASTIKAEYIIDDSWHVIKEAKGIGKCCFAVQTPWCDHWRFNEARGVKVVNNFVEAANEILDSL